MKLRETILCERIEKLKDKPIWYGLSKNHSINFRYVFKMFPDKPWDWKNLSWNPSITWKDVLEHPDKPWNWKGLTSIIFLDVLEHPDKPWNTRLKHPDKPWNWTALSWNPSITFQDVLEQH